MTNTERGPKIPKLIRFGEHGGRVVKPNPSYEEIADRVGAGEFLMYLDIQNIFERNNITSDRHDHLRFNVDTGRLTVATDNPIASLSYRRKIIYYNPTLPPEVIEQKLTETRLRIDQAIYQEAITRGKRKNLPS